MKAKTTAAKSAPTNHEASRPLEGGAHGGLGHDSPTEHRLSITSATSGRLVLIQPPCPSAHRSALAFDGTDAVDKG